MSEAESTNDVAALTVQLLSVYLANNAVPSEDLAGLIRSTKEALGGELAAVAQAEPETAKAAVSVRKSLASPEHIISLIDGKPYKTLKRHLMAHGLTPDAYRSRYNLPASYPMVAPAYADHRRAVAQRIGLGARRSAAQEVAGSKDDHLDASGTVDAQTSLVQAAPEPEDKQKRAIGANKDAGTRSAKARAANAGKSSRQPLKVNPPAQERTLSDVPNSADGESSPVEATAAPEPAKPAPKARPAKSTPAKAPREGRGKSKAVAAGGADPADTSMASDLAADEQDAQGAAKPQRRAKLGVFKKSAATSDTGAGGDTAPAEEALSQPGESASSEPVAPARAPAKRKSPKRMARSSSAPSEGGAAK